MRKFLLRDSGTSSEQERMSLQSVPVDVARNIMSHLTRRETIAHVKPTDRRLAKAAKDLSESENRACGQQGFIAARAHACMGVPAEQYITLPDGTRCCRLLCTPMLEVATKSYHDRNPVMEYYIADRREQEEDHPHGGVCFVPGETSSLLEKKSFMKLYMTLLFQTIMRLKKYVFSRVHIVSLMFRFEGGLEFLHYHHFDHVYMIVLFRKRPLAMLYNVNLWSTRRDQLRRIYEVLSDLRREGISEVDSYAIQVNVPRRSQDTELARIMDFWFPRKYDYFLGFCVFTKKQGILPESVLFRPFSVNNQVRQMRQRLVTDAFLRVYNIFRQEMVEPSKKGLLRGQVFDKVGRPLSPIRLLAKGEQLSLVNLEDSSSDSDT